MIRYCENGCHVTDRSKDICPSCGAFMKETGDSDREKIIDNIKQMQQESGRDFTKGRYVNNRI